MKETAKLIVKIVPTTAAAFLVGGIIVADCRAQSADEFAKHARLLGGQLRQDVKPEAQTVLRKSSIPRYPWKKDIGTSVFWIGQPAPKNQPKAIEKICRIKNIDPQKAQLSFICKNLSNLSQILQCRDYIFMITLL